MAPSRKGGLPQSYEYRPFATRSVLLKGHTLCPQPQSASPTTSQLLEWEYILLITLHTRNMEEELHQITPDPDLPLAAQGYKPTHPDLVKVKFAPGSYASWLVAVKVCPFTFRWVDPSHGVATSFQAFKRDEIICFLSHATLTPTRLYSTVQWGPRQEDNLELNSDLLYGQTIGGPRAGRRVSGH